jgi:hypothetical protein
LPELEAALPKALANQAEWKLSASHNAEAAVNATGTTAGARWDTAGAAQQAGMWFQIELPQAARVAEVQIDTALPFSFGGRGRAGGGRGPAGAGGAPPARGGAPPAAGRGGPPIPIAGPVAYTLQVSMDGSSWGAPVAQGAGSAPTTVIAFTPVEAKFVRITQTGAAAGTEQWAIAQVRVFTK